MSDMREEEARLQPRVLRRAWAHLANKLRLCFLKEETSKSVEHKFGTVRYFEDEVEMGKSCKAGNQFECNSNNPGLP